MNDTSCVNSFVNGGIIAFPLDSSIFIFKFLDFGIFEGFLLIPVLLNNSHRESFKIR